MALKLGLYPSSGDTVAQRPTVIEVHGGGSSGGDGSVKPLVKNRCVAVAINYRVFAPAAGCSGWGVLNLRRAQH